MRNGVLRRRRWVVALTCTGAASATAVLAAGGSGPGASVSAAALLVLLAGLAAELHRTRLSLRALRAEAASLAAGDRLGQVEGVQSLLCAELYDRAAGRRGGPERRVPAGLVPTTVRALVDRGDVLDAYALAGDSLVTVDKPTLRRLRGALGKRGYLARALEVALICVECGGDARDRRERAALEGEIAVLSGAFTPRPRPGAPADPRPRRILHVVGKSLPEYQSGYTLRTHYTVLAQRHAGLDPHVVTQTGFGRPDGYQRTVLDGVTYHRLPGPVRGAEPFDIWLDRNVQRVANVVRAVRPAALHAASDFVNAVTAQAVGREFGIPVVYESRGFWEETWLSRQARHFGWDLERLADRHGLPDAYLWRREIEDRCRRAADRVITLADVMADRIEEGGVPRDRIDVIPNGVDPAAFPVQSRNGELAGRLGIRADTIVVGYISSLVEYEGIDTLVAAYAAMRASAPGPVSLLIVGDGPERARLTAQAAALGLDDAIFTGQVPHDDILDYYGLIDIFVVPRRPVEVCHLVTPLKPFEAFATGRAVVLSDVRALAAIARESQAAELFTAGDELSLAGVLIALAKDPHRRRQLADRAAAWVRAERTWAGNADRYLFTYERLGILPAGTFHLQHLKADLIDTADLRAKLSARPPVPLEAVCDEDHVDGADEIMEVGWTNGTCPVASLALPIEWSTLCGPNRSWAFQVHAWDFMVPVLRAHAATGERRYLDWCVDRAVSWARAFTDRAADDTMAWYDMALGLRGYRLAYLVEQAVRHDAPAETISLLLACVVRHQQEFFVATAFNPGNNHGVYVAIGELALARRLRDLPGMEVLERQGRERLAVMAANQFAADGGHLEHSPEYHRMLLDAFSGALNAGLLDDELRGRIGLAAEVLGWFIQPDGELAQVGDSLARPMMALNPRTSDPFTEFLQTGGRRGRPNSRRLRVLPDTGYAIVRSPQPQGTDDHQTASYLLLAAGFHSRVHKHADDLSLIWFERGIQILIDAGRYGYVDLLPADSPLRQEGYYYGAPERQYVESTRAHNTVEADGRDHRRRGREPYGSAILDAVERDGHFRIRAEVDHGTWSHHREVVLRPGDWLLVTDRLSAPEGIRHDYRVWWNFPEQVVPRQAGPAGLRLCLPGSTDPLWCVELGGSEVITPVTAQRDPMRGWRSKSDLRVTPAWSTGFSAMGVRTHEFRTLFRFGMVPPTTSPESPFAYRGTACPC